MSVDNSDVHTNSFKDVDVISTGLAGLLVDFVQL